MLFFQHTMRLYRKSASVFDTEGDYKFTESPNLSLQLSPQEDMIVYYNSKSKSICWSFNWESSEKNSYVHEVKFKKI